MWGVNRSHPPNGGVAVSAGLDNQYRYLSGYYLSLFFGIWYVLGDIDKRGTVLRLLVLAITLAPYFRTVPRPGCPVDI